MTLPISTSLASPAPDFTWHVDRFVLYRSVNTADGVRYDELGSWPLLP